MFRLKLALTKRADYAIRAVLALAQADGSEPLSVRRIANEQSIPAAFLPAVMRDLLAANLATSIAGRTGGYRLARPAADVSLLDIVEAVEGGARRGGCVLRGGPCRLGATCAVHPVFAAAHQELLGRLARAMVGDLAR